MARVTIELPETFPFSTEIRVRVNDLNYGGHLGFEALVNLIHEARIRFLKEYGFTELDIDGAGFLQIDAAVIHKAEIFHGEALVIEAAAGEFSKSGCDFVYRITNKKTGYEVSRAKTGMIFFDYKKRKVVKVPERFKEGILS